MADVGTKRTIDGEEGGNKKQKVQTNEPCRFYQRGDCKFGTRCKSLHDINSLNPKIRALVTANQLSKKATTVCAFFAKGQCKFGARCQSLHPQQPGAQPAFHPFMGTTAGTFNPGVRLPPAPAHARAGPASAAGPKRKWRSIPCKFFGEGKCKYGDNCKNQHAPADGGGEGAADDDDAIVGASNTTKATRSNNKNDKNDDICVFWKKGSCKFAAACRSRHPAGLEGVNRPTSGLGHPARGLAPPMYGHHGHGNHGHGSYGASSPFGAANPNSAPPGGGGSPYGSVQMQQMPMPMPYGGGGTAPPGIGTNPYSDLATNPYSMYSLPQGMFGGGAVAGGLPGSGAQMQSSGAPGDYPTSSPTANPYATHPGYAF